MTFHKSFYNESTGNAFTLPPTPSIKNRFPYIYEKTYKWCCIKASYWNEINSRSGIFVLWRPENTGKLLLCVLRLVQMTFLYQIPHVTDHKNVHFSISNDLDKIIYVVGNIECAKHKKLKFHLISGYGNFVDTVYNWVCTKFPYQEIRWVYCI